MEVSLVKREVRPIRIFIIELQFSKHRQKRSSVANFLEIHK